MIYFDGWETEVYNCHICNQDEADVIIKELNMAVEIKKSHTISQKPRSQIGKLWGCTTSEESDIPLRKNSGSFGHCLYYNTAVFSQEHVPKFCYCRQRPWMLCTVTSMAPFSLLYVTDCVSTRVGWKTDAIQCLTIERGNNNKTWCWNRWYNVDKITWCKKRWESWRCVWRPNGYISKRNLVSDYIYLNPVTPMIIDQGQHQQCLGPTTFFFLKPSRCLCSTWSGPSSSSMVVRLVGGPSFHGGSGGYLNT